MVIDETLSMRPVKPADLGLLRDWIGRPHWQEWWGPVDREIDYIQDMLAGRDTTRPFLFCRGEEPVGYIQVWSIADQVDAGWAEEEAWLLHAPSDAVGVDLSIGDINQLGKGIGSRVLADFAVTLGEEGHRTILIDPDSDNTRAIRAYEKAGFRSLPHLTAKAYDCVIMQFEFNSPMETQ